MFYIFINTFCQSIFSAKTNCTREVIFGDISLNQGDTVGIMKNLDPNLCKDNCNFEKGVCHSYLYDKITMECILFSKSLKSLQQNARLLGAHRDCIADFNQCVSYN